MSAERISTIHIKSLKGKTVEVHKGEELIVPLRENIQIKKETSNLGVSA